MPYCIASSGDHDKMRMTLGATGLLPLFDGRMFSATEVRARQACARRVSACGASGWVPRPRACVVIEDSVNGVLAGRAAGMTVFGFVGLIAGRAARRRGRAATFTHMRELR